MFLPPLVKEASFVSWDTCLCSEASLKPTRNPVSSRLMLNHKQIRKNRAHWRQCAWHGNNWAPYWFVECCFSFDSPAFNQLTEPPLSPWFGVHLHAAPPAHLLLVTSLSFPIASVWIRISLQGKVIFLCNPQFNTLTWHQYPAAISFF